MSRSARHWNLRRRKELGPVRVRAVTTYLRGRPLAELSEWCDSRRARGMPDATLEALLDACAWKYRHDRDPGDPRLNRVRLRQSKAYWRAKGLMPPPRNLRREPRRCQLCTARMPWAATRCRACGLDQWNPHLRRWEPTTKETA